MKTSSAYLIMFAVVIGIVAYSYFFGFAQGRDVKPFVLSGVFYSIIFVLLFLFLFIKVKFNAHAFWLVLIIIFAVAFVAAFFYKDWLTEILGIKNQGMLWGLITAAGFVSIIYFSKT